MAYRRGRPLPAHPVCLANTDASCRTHFFAGPSHNRLLGPGSGVAVVWQVQVSLCSLCCQNHHADDTARATVPFDGLPQGSLDKVYALLLVHALLPVRVTVSVDVCRTGSCDGIRLFV